MKHLRASRKTKFAFYCVATLLTIAGYYLGKPARLAKPELRTFAQAQPEMASALEALDRFSQNSQLEMTQNHSAFRFFLRQLPLTEGQQASVAVIGRTLAYQQFSTSEVHSDFEIVAFDDSHKDLVHRESREIRRVLEDSLKKHQETNARLLNEHDQAEDAANASREMRGAITFWLGIVVGFVTALMELLPSSGQVAHQG